MPQFDVEAARRSGATDDEILSYLAQRSQNFDVQGALKQASKGDVISYLATHSSPAGGQTSSTQASISNQPAFGTMPWLKSKLYSAADEVTQGLPAAGATLGAILGGGTGALTGGTTSIPGAIGGAGIGGMGGEALRQLTRRGLGFESPATSQDAAAQITKEGAIQGGLQAATEVLPLAAPALKNAALKQYGRALAPTTNANKAIVQDIAPDMMQRGLRGGLESIEDRAAANANAIRPQLDAAYANVPANATQGSGTKIIQDLDRLKTKYMVDGNIANPEAINAINGTRDVVLQYGADISPQSLRRLKSIFDDPVAKAGGFTGADLVTQYSLKAKEAAANSIRDILHSTSPDVAALDKEISFWLDVQRVTSESGLRRTGQEGGLMKVVTPLASTVAGAAGFSVGGTHAGLAAGAGTAMAAMLAQAVRTPAWRTTSAVLKDRVADAVARGSVGDVAALLVRFGVAAQSTQEGNAMVTGARTTGTTKLKDLLNPQPQP